MDIAEPFVTHDSILLTHGRRTPRAYVLLHGLTASPRQFAAFGALLHARGANVWIPRLPRHGHGDRLTTALGGLTAAELRVAARSAVDAGRELGDEVVVAGFSLGGLLSAWIGQHFAVARTVSIAPFLGIFMLPGSLHPDAIRFMLRAPNRFIWWNPLLRERLEPEHGYPRFPTHAIAHAASLAQELFGDARARAPAAADVRLVINERESAVNNRAVLRLERLWAARGGERVHLHRLRGLPASHDIIEPLRSPAIVARVYPLLADVVGR